MKVYTQATIEVAGHDDPKGTMMDIPDALLPSFADKVAYLADGELRTPRSGRTGSGERFKPVGFPGGIPR